MRAIGGNTWLGYDDPSTCIVMQFHSKASHRNLKHFGCEGPISVTSAQGLQNMLALDVRQGPKVKVRHTAPAEFDFRALQSPK